MNNITAETIANAYKKTGLRPITSEWGKAPFIDGKQVICGCGMTALIASTRECDINSLIFSELLDEIQADGVDTVVDFLEGKASISFVSGFVYGFDDIDDEDILEDEMENKEWLDGRRVGDEARKLIFDIGTHGISPKPEFIKE